MYFNPDTNDYGDALYLKSLFSGDITEILVMLDETLDRLEYDTSTIYDEFPDKERIRKIALDISESENISKDLAELLVLNEILFRRIRRRAI